MSEGYIIGGGSSGGGTLVVTGVAGDTVTVSKDGKTRTRVFDSSGKATFRGLASGTWTLIMTNGVQTATRTVEITADYSVSIAYFAATINITYPAGSTCTATDGATTLTAPDTTGTWACVVPNTGTWTINCTDGSQTATNTVTISTDGESKSLVLSYRLYLVRSGVPQYSFETDRGTFRHATYNSKYCYGISSGGNAACIGYIHQPFNLTQYKTLTIVMQHLDGWGGGHGSNVWINNTVPSIDVNTNALSSYIAKAIVDLGGSADVHYTGEHTFTLDISSINQNCYIGVNVSGTSAFTGYFDFSDLYLD